MHHPLGIAGLGLVSGLGLGAEATFAHLLRGDTAVRPLTRFDATPYAQPKGGQLAPADEAALLARYGESDLTWGLILAAAEEALGPRPAAPDPELGLVLATNFGLMETLSWCWQERLDTGDLDAATFCAQQDVVSRVARQLSAAGPAVQLSLSCASGAAALHLAAEWLRAGRATRVLALGYDVLTEFVWCGLSNLRTITPELVRPFDRRRQGTIFSEGAAAMLLSTRPADAPRLLGYLAGAATNNNAFHLTAPAKDAAGSRRAMAAALADAGLPPAAVDCVSAHATATVANDSTESAALHHLLGRPVPTAAFKANLGHLLGAAGLAEAILALLALRHGTVPPIVNLDEPDPVCTVDAVRGAARRGTLRTALTDSAGIGGNNAATVLTTTPPPAAPAVAARPLALRQAAWVLPGHIGHGPILPTFALPQLLHDSDQLAQFSVKPYLDTVKGYLDGAGKYALAAAALCLRGTTPHAAPSERFGVVAVTQYGAPGSGFDFYQQLRTKGPRLASPLIFPHGYANTAPNLVAIEFGLAGPHLVLNNATDLAEAWWIATHLLQRGLADDVLLLAVEAVRPTLVPNGWPVLNGALAWWLTTGPGEPLPPTPLQLPDNRAGTLAAALA